MFKKKFSIVSYMLYAGVHQSHYDLVQETKQPHSLTA